ncbi:MAG: bifunctional 3,4-dihydroxy-2-butanone-4-phosphate synthase/GTP cyclohydrolase II [Candidatus Heimdallarchaeum aukensis]|uniref:GTP cyclohydrolase II n=1 Tax=Candidatus Heimdallarchaeum aukensis TaxID=2876573 RepID=A0A9Y1BL66_9ARCH|nr:MAG: bifunctional 3,4-dihydroxy-2-butanone-4-phosphate synthase/GTP cyclohydrolase II [Candidatus Heimdallarchaeum aukensis]
MFNSIEEAIKDLKEGKCIIVIDNEERENEGDLVALADRITPDTINFMIRFARGLVCVPITSERARELNLSLMVTKNNDPNQTAFTVSIDSIDCTTGISAYERAKTVRDITDRTKKAEDFRRPGHIFPLIAVEGGVLKREGHTEASVDLAKICNAFPAAVICEIIKDDGHMARVPELLSFAQRYGLKIITISSLIEYRLKNESFVERVVETNIPTKFGTFKIIGYSDKYNGLEHIALIKGEIKENQSILIRLHSECLTGDVLKSLKCDCGSQLEKSMEMIAEEGTGVLLYLRQEGRGIGLLNKLKAYKLQECGYDTFDANLKLGFPADLRDYKIAADILKDLGINEIRILTNNPDKIKKLEKYNIKIAQRIPLRMDPNIQNYAYLKAKQEKLGHLLNIIDN